MEFSSKLIEKAVNEIAQLPGIGKRSLAAGVAFIETAQRANWFFAQAL
jgi:recombination protein RecR